MSSSFWTIEMICIMQYLFSRGNDQWSVYICHVFLIIVFKDKFSLHEFAYKLVHEIFFSLTRHRVQKCESGHNRGCNSEIINLNKWKVTNWCKQLISQMTIDKSIISFYIWYKNTYTAKHLSVWRKNSSVDDCNG